MESSTFSAAASARSRWRNCRVAWPLRQAHQVELRLLDAQGKLVIAPASLQFQSAGATLGPGQEVSISTVTVLQPMFGEPGKYTVEFWTGGNQLGVVNLHVEERVPPSPVPAERPN
jgi:hypothetical protein